MSYQGHITSTDGAVTGVHPITVRLYSDPDGKHKLWEDTYSADIKDGTFSVQLGTRNPLPPTHRLDRPIWLGVSIEGTDELRPLTQFTAAPYALTVPDRSITKEKLSEDLQTLITKPIGGQVGQSTTVWTFAGDNVTTSGDELLGTMSTSTIKNWQLITNGIHTMRFEDNGSATPNIIGGYSGNTISVGIDGGVIAGGGESGSINSIESDYSTISGGLANDDLGRVVYEEKLQATVGTNSRTIPIPSNWSGTFYLRLQMGKDVVTGKFVKQ